MAEGITSVTNYHTILVSYSRLKFRFRVEVTTHRLQLTESDLINYEAKVADGQSLTAQKSRALAPKGIIMLCE